jgi:hypothetical protein
MVQFESVIPAYHICSCTFTFLSINSRATSTEQLVCFRNGYQIVVTRQGTPAAKRDLRLWFRLGGNAPREWTGHNPSPPAPEPPCLSTPVLIPNTVTKTRFFVTSAPGGEGKTPQGKIAVALHSALGRVPKKEEIEQVFLLTRVMYKKVQIRSRSSFVTKPDHRTRRTLATSIVSPRRPSGRGGANCGHGCERTNLQCVPVLRALLHHVLGRIMDVGFARHITIG